MAAGTGPHAIAPGGAGTIGTLNLSGLTTSSNTTLEYDLGSPVSGGSYTGDLINFTTGSGLTVGSGTNLAFGADPTAAGDYRLFSGAFGSPVLSNFVLPTAPSLTSYSLSSVADPGFIDLVVTTSANSAQWDHNGDGAWSTNADWFPTTFPQGVGQTATFGNGSTTVINAPTVKVTVDAPIRLAA